MVKTGLIFNAWQFQDRLWAQFFALYRLKVVPGPSLLPKSRFFIKKLRNLLKKCQCQKKWIFQRAKRAANRCTGRSKKWFFPRAKRAANLCHFHCKIRWCQIESCPDASHTLIDNISLSHQYYCSPTPPLPEMVMVWGSSRVPHVCQLQEAIVALREGGGGLGNHGMQKTLI